MPSRKTLRCSILLFQDEEKEGEEMEDQLYTPAIGLEIHAQLLTQSKIFCNCKVDFGGEANTRCCPVCLGFPGTLPVLNKEVVRLAIKAAIALGCTINTDTKMDRKNYFYPDLPKAYQISQLDLPIGVDGKVKIDLGEKEKYIKIKRIHIEEDAGKLIHDATEDTSLVDYNRCGVPLIEIVTDPDITSKEEAKLFIEKVSGLLQYANVSDCKMEEGSLRVDVNVSLKKEGQDELGTKVELKNLNSLKSIVRAIDYEIKRQSKLLRLGETIKKETRRFNDHSGDTSPLRDKEYAHDYRYFKEPDIVPLKLTKENIDSIKNTLPVLIDERIDTYVNQFKISKEDAQNITYRKELSDFYNEAVKAYPNYKSVANFMIVELYRYINEGYLSSQNIPFSPEDFALLVKMTDEEIIGRNNAKEVLKMMIEKSQSPMTLAKEHNFIISNDLNEVEEVVKKVLEEHKEEVEAYLNGKTKLFTFFMGQCSKILKGNASPKIIREMLEKNLITK